MAKRAVIYVRVSSEGQVKGKASPKMQLADFRKLANEHGFEILAELEDIQRYRSRNKLVELSGARVSTISQRSSHREYI